MPSTSAKQARFMAAVAHSPKFAKKVGVPVSVGKDFNEADKGRKFGKGGSTMAESKKQMEMRHARTLSKLAKEEAAEAKKYRHGGKVKRMAVGGATAPLAGDLPTATAAGSGNPLYGGAYGAQSPYQTQQQQPKQPYNPATLTVGEDTEPQQTMFPSAYRKGGVVSSASRRGDGIASKGKTRGKIF